MKTRLEELQERLKKVEEMTKTLGKEFNGATNK
jgi:hypothetical protein